MEVDGPIWEGRKFKVFDIYVIKKVRRAVYTTEKLSGSFVPSREFLLTCVPLLTDGDLTEPNGGAK